MEELTVTAFVEKVHGLLQEKDCRLTWFLGAGCSISSGIPGTKVLAEVWLRRLKDKEGAHDAPLNEWAKKRYPGFDPHFPNRFYGRIISDLFPSPEERQREIERLIAKKDPSIGYALLALLAAHENYGPRSNVVVTTNFDDLVADSLYLLARQRPLVIAHENLARFARASGQRPLVVKVHGDANLSPKNTRRETRVIARPLAKAMKDVLGSSALIFCGYNGDDASVAHMIKKATPSEFQYGVYWIGVHPPRGDLKKWLDRKKKAFHVPLDNFDSLLIQLGDRASLTLPSEIRFADLFARWSRGLAASPLVSRDEGQEATNARDRLRHQLTAIQLAIEARVAAALDSDRANRLYADALAEDPNNVAVLCDFAGFLTDFLGDLDGAEKVYKKAIRIDPRHAGALGNYASFLADDRKNLRRAESMYLRAKEADPHHANNLGNFALFLTEDLKAFDRAEQMFEWAIAADPHHANNLGNYANFLTDFRRDFDRAERMFERAIEADHHHASNLGDHAAFLANIRQKRDEARAEFQRAIEADGNHANNLGHFANFIVETCGDLSDAEMLYQRAIEADPVHASTLGSFANVLAEFGVDPDRAEEMYRRAIEADPTHADNLGNYANFLKNVRGDANAADAMYRRAIEVNPIHANNLGNYADFLKNVFGDSERAGVMYERALKVGPSPVYNLWNYALLLCARGSRRKARNVVDLALMSADTPPPLRAEVLFCAVAHEPNSLDEGKELRRLVDDGVRSPGWCQAVERDRLYESVRSDVDFFRDLAEVLAGSREPISLERYPKWESWCRLTETPVGVVASA